MAVLKAFARMDGLDPDGLGVALEALRPGLVLHFGLCADPSRQGGRSLSRRTLFGVHELEEMPQIGREAFAVGHREQSRHDFEVDDLAIEHTGETPTWPRRRRIVQPRGPPLPGSPALVSGDERPREVGRGPAEERRHDGRPRLAVASGCRDGIEPCRKPLRDLGGEDRRACRRDGGDLGIAQRPLHGRGLRMAVDQHRQTAGLVDAGRVAAVGRRERGDDLGRGQTGEIRRSLLGDGFVECAPERTRVQPPDLEPWRGVRVCGCGRIGRRHLHIVEAGRTERVGAGPPKRIERIEHPLVGAVVDAHRPTPIAVHRARGLRVDMHIRAAESIDRLLGVTDEHQAPVPEERRLQHGPLRGIGVLELVDKHGVVAFAHATCDGAVGTALFHHAIGEPRQHGVEGQHTAASEGSVETPPHLRGEIRQRCEIVPERASGIDEHIQREDQRPIRFTRERVLVAALAQFLLERRAQP